MARPPTALLQYHAHKAVDDAIVSGALLNQLALHRRQIQGSTSS